MAEPPTSNERDARARLAKEIADLPTLSAVVARVLQVTANPASSIVDLERVISSDVSLSGRILRAANSGLYSLPQRIASVKHAATILGFRVVRSLALSSAIVDALSERGGAAMLRHFRLHALAAAMGARTIAQRGRLYDPEEAFTLGLLHDIGKVMFYRMDRSKYEGLLGAAPALEDLPEMEREAFGLDHAEAGAMVLDYWRLPEDLSSAVRNHHVGKSALTAVLREADAAAHAAGFHGTPLSPPSSAEGDPFLVCEIERMLDHEETLF